MAKCYVQLGRLAEGRMAYEKALELDKGNTAAADEVGDEDVEEKKREC
jgi:hypothetical protein